jgi:H-type small acid-soluble spore protein
MESNLRLELFNMDEQRVKEIMNSKGVIEVLYHGAQVWIDSVKENNTALVHYISNNKKDEVPVYELIET